MPQPNGSAIQKRRQELGIHRSDLATTVGLSYPHLYNIENGLKVASIEALYRIAKALGLQIDDVLDESRGDTTGPEPRRPGENPVRYPKTEKPDTDDEPDDDQSRWSA